METNAKLDTIQYYAKTVSNTKNVTMRIVPTFT